MQSLLLLLRGVLLATFVLTGFVGVAHAQSVKGPRAADKSEKSEAARLKKEGDALMDQDRHVDALALYARAYELSSDPVLLYNQGRALEAMGDYADALEKLERFDREGSPSLRAKVPGLRDLIADLRGRVATLIVTTNTPGARLLIREKVVGTIQKETRLRTRAGPATVEVAADGYATFKTDIDLAGGTVVRIDAPLTLKKSDALVIVRSRPSADIAVDGKAFGRSPIEIRLRPGQHTLVAAAAGRETERVPMTLALGERRELDIDLQEPPSVLSRWWFWTAVGVVAAGAVASYFVVTTERSPQPGTFGQGNVIGP